MESLRLVIIPCFSCGDEINIPINSRRRYCEKCIKEKQSTAQRITSLKLIVRVKHGN
jgi:hypothetical protein